MCFPQEKSIVSVITGSFFEYKTLKEKCSRSEVCSLCLVEAGQLKTLKDRRSRSEVCSLRVVETDQLETLTERCSRGDVHWMWLRLAG